MTGKNTISGLVGIILAGGGSRRMFASTGGGDKGLLDLGGKPMLAHVIARFRPQVRQLILNANGDAARFAEFGLEVVPDSADGQSHGQGYGRGPLAGLLAAMRWAAASNGGADVFATVSGDVPFLPDDAVARLMDGQNGTQGKVAIAASAGQRHPTIGLWPIGLLDDLAAALARGELSVDRFAKRHSAIEVSFPMRNIGGYEVDPFFNANTPDDLARAREILIAVT